MSCPRWTWASKISASGGRLVKSSCANASTSVWARTSASSIRVSLRMAIEEPVASGAVTDVSIWADTIHSPEMRQEVPVPIPHTFLYLEHAGERHVVTTPFEVERVQ